MENKFSVTLAALRKAGACYSGYNKLVRALQGKPFSDAANERSTYIRFAHKSPISIEFILESNGLDDALWALCCVTVMDRDLRLLAVWYARQVEHLAKDQRVKNALDTSERYANGEATDEELMAARDAAGDVAWAARDAAVDAAWAARAAAWAAAAVAAWDAAAGDAAWDAARANQQAMLVKMLHGEAPWQLPA